MDLEKSGNYQNRLMIWHVEVAINYFITPISHFVTSLDIVKEWMEK